MDETERVARRLGKTKSELVRDALRRHIELDRLRELQHDARARAEARGVGPEDVEALIDEARGGLH